MDAAEEIERHIGVHRHAIEARPVGVVMRHGRSGADLQQQHDRHEQEILAGLALAGRQRAEADQHRVHRRHIRVRQEDLVDEQHGAEAKEHEAEACPGPDEGRRGGRVADDRLIRPVLRPRHRAAGPIGDGSQRGIDQKICRLPRGLRVKAPGLAVTRGKIVLPQLRGDAFANRRDGTRQSIGKGDGVLGQIHPMQLCLHTGFGFGLLIRPE